jgi:predicted pyridoxine 5'-phosphate oxidase superfamily flavin-nucleotide-binding protein
MADKFMQLVLTPAVQRAQDQYFGRHQVVQDAPETNPLTPDEADFIASRDSFYMATISETGWPYIQHRGGPPGFVKVLSPNLIGFADFRGNRQLISTGNLAATDRVALFLMDYPSRTRLKLLAPGPLRGNIERLFLIQIVSYDWNCQQHITPRFTTAEVEAQTAPLKARIEELEAKIAAYEGRPGA